MVTDLKKLIALCKSELVDRGYGGRQRELEQGWDQLTQWMDEQGFTEFSEAAGFKFCDENYGGHLLSKDLDKQARIGLRAVRMLISFQKTGDFEFRSPSVEHCFSGNSGKPFELYLLYARDVLGLSVSTVQNKEFYLHAFYTYLDGRSLALDDLSVEIVEDFFYTMDYTLAARHNGGSTLRIFLRYVFDIGLTKKDLSFFVLPDNYNHSSKLPNTYEESEIRRIIEAVDRASAIGKRDYLILLLAAEYGWRSKDIVSFRFDQIDWDKNVINYTQSKTQTPAEYPLLASIGNAIIDYMKNGRPDAGSDTVIVAAESAKRGKPLTSPTVHSIVTRYIRKANIKDWENKKHGAHSLRHSLASNMLKKNVSIPIISMVMGHQSTETTKVYLSIDIDRLRQCPLTMPRLSSPHYRMRVM